MNKLEAKKLIEETLQHHFDKDKYARFLRELLNQYDDTKTFSCNNAYVKESFKESIHAYERIGKYQDTNKKTIDLLIVRLQKESSLAKARTVQRNFIAQYLKDRDHKDAALIAFVSPNNQDWRFSLVKMEYALQKNEAGKTKATETFTPARRWSFLVGANENSHTAQSRLAPLVMDDEHNPTLNDLEEAFNIETVTREFFEKYRETFLRVHETLKTIVNEHSDIERDFTAKSVNLIDFSKKLLGQIVFLYFLQKKGWFGVASGKQWGEGDKGFLRTLYKESSSRNRNYFNDYLEPLFYEALAKERDDDFYSRFDCKIPFLNGGLFDPINNYDWVNTNIELPNELFSNTVKDAKTGDIGNGILDIFDRYNFTAKEDEPLDKEVAVDPEMLGKVFENLLEVKDRKSRGTYYTPREIVHYMCQQSLIQYLITETGIEHNRIEKIIKHNSVLNNEEFLEWKKADGKPASKALALWEVEWTKIDKVLEDIKIVDPACGSGAFLVGMLQEIVRTRALVQIYNGRNQAAYTLKESAIKNSIYGVDIDPGAVEIAKLRLWLSLIVDEEDITQIKPLPNLDYKVMQGNSLLEEYEGIKLFDDKIITAPDYSKETEIADIQKRQTTLQREYITLHQSNKLTPAKKTALDLESKQLHSRLKQLQSPKSSAEKIGLFDAYSEAKIKTDKLKLLHNEFFATTQKKKKDEIRKQIESLEWELIEATLQEQGKISALKKVEALKRSNTKPFFSGN